MGMPRLSIFSIANLHQTCLGLVWRFAQDEPSCDGDIPANNFKLPYTNILCLPTFVFNFSFKMMLLEMISNWFGVCWNSSCHKVSQTACILLWDAVSDGQVVHHCPELWRWTAATLSTPLSSESVNLLTAVYNTLHSLNWLLKSLCSGKHNTKCLENFWLLGGFNTDFCQNWILTWVSGEDRLIIGNFLLQLYLLNISNKFLRQNFRLGADKAFESFVVWI